MWFNGKEFGKTESVWISLQQQVGAELQQPVLDEPIHCFQLFNFSQNSPPRTTAASSLIGFKCQER